MEYITCTVTPSPKKSLNNYSRVVLTNIFLLILAACGGGGGDGDGDSTPAQPQNVQALAGNEQATISWDNVSTATAYDICTASETITQPENCSVHQNGTLAVDQTSPAIISGLSNGAHYFFVVIPKNATGDGAASAVVSVTVGPVLPTPTGKLNDTGITLCGDYAFDNTGNHQNDLDCSLATDAEGDPIPQGQDADSGRDANPATNENSDGHKGFSFTKLDSDGFALTDQSSATFSCVKDNVTGLIWEGKQTATGLHNRDDVYTWFSTDVANNGLGIGTESANGSCEGKDSNFCNTQAYAARVNTASLCAATNWRLPSRKELRSLVSYDRINPAIDATYFPNTANNRYWSSSPAVDNNNNATWYVFFTNGDVSLFNKGTKLRVRLVRSGQ